MRVDQSRRKPGATGAKYISHECADSFGLTRDHAAGQDMSEMTEASAFSARRWAAFVVKIDVLLPIG